MERGQGVGGDGEEEMYNKDILIIYPYRLTVTVFAGESESVSGTVPVTVTISHRVTGPGLGLRRQLRLLRSESVARGPCRPGRRPGTLRVQSVAR